MASETPPKQTSAMRSSFSRKMSLHRGRGVDPHRLVAFRLQRVENLLPLDLAAGFHRDVELGSLGRHVEKEPAMVDLENVGAELAEPSGDLPEHAGPVGEGQPEGDDAVLSFELAHHDGSENARIDVAAAQDQSHFAPAEFFRLDQHG